MCSLCSRVVKATRSGHLVDHLVSDKHAKKVERATKRNALSWLPPPGHSDRVRIYATHDKIHKSNRENQRKKKKITPKTRKERLATRQQERKEMRDVFASGHRAIVHSNALPSLLAPTQPTLFVCGTDMHGITALKGMLNDGHPA